MKAFITLPLKQFLAGAQDLSGSKATEFHWRLRTAGVIDGYFPDIELSMVGGDSTYTLARTLRTVSIERGGPGKPPQATGRVTSDSTRRKHLNSKG